MLIPNMEPVRKNAGKICLKIIIKRTVLHTTKYIVEFEKFQRLTDILRAI